jgi:hypothetical protein
MSVLGLSRQKHWGKDTYNRALGLSSRIKVEVHGTNLRMILNF